MTVGADREDGERPDAERRGRIRVDRAERQMVGAGGESKRGIEERRASDQPLELRIEVSQLVAPVTDRDREQRVPGAVGQLMKP